MCGPGITADAAAAGDGQFREAGLAVASFLQHTSRADDIQLHVHNVIAHAARTDSDGKWRAPDSYAYNEVHNGVAPIAALHLESALTQRFGVAWTPRADGYGHEITGVTQQVMDALSTRRASNQSSTCAGAQPSLSGRRGASRASANSRSSRRRSRWIHVTANRRSRWISARRSRRGRTRCAARLTAPSWPTSRHRCGGKTAAALPGCQAAAVPGCHRRRWPGRRGRPWFGARGEIRVDPL